MFLVKSLIEATARVFDRRGMHLTTRDVAEEAGVSVGSLYQYFKDKDQLLDALVREIAREVSEVFMSNLHERLALDYATFYRTSLTAIVALLSSKPGYLAVARHWHELRTAKAVQATEQELIVVAQQYMLRHFEDYGSRDLQVHMFIAYNSTVHTVMHYLSLAHPPFGIDRLVDGLTTMMSAYVHHSDANHSVKASPRTPAKKRRVPR